MSKQQELDKLDRAIKDADIRLKSIKNSLDVIDKEISQLILVQGDLEANLEVLKKKQIVAMALEFKKSKSELERTKARLSMLRINKDSAQSAFDDMQKFLTKAKQEYATVLKACSNNVLKFGRKK